MRDIKFRAWHTRKEIMLSVEVIDFTNNNEDGTKGYVAFKEGIKGYSEMISGYERCETDYACNLEDIILMQYSGLQDDNEKDIYEGDIVIPTVLGEKQGKWVVSYSEERARYIIRDIANKDIEEDIDNFCSYQVIGNIYENPELLEPEE